MIDKFTVSFNTDESAVTFVFLIWNPAVNQDLSDKLKDWLFGHGIAYTIQMHGEYSIEMSIPCPQAQVIIKMAFTEYAPQYK